jgi:hypothetical protein
MSTRENGPLRKLKFMRGRPYPLMPVAVWRLRAATVAVRLWDSRASIRSRLQ